MKKTISTFLLLFLLVPVFRAQQPKVLALAKARKALKLEDGGDTAEAIRLLKEASGLDSADIDYRYELGYAYCSKKEYDSALFYLAPLLPRKDVNELIYELAGTCYMQTGEPDKARRYFEEGLRKFPLSGRLLYEEGLLEIGKKEYNRALVYFEKGIENDPAFGGNYYWAAKLFCHSTEPVWGMIYGEIFVNLNRGSSETSEISKLLYDTYVNDIRIGKDSAVTVNFSKFSTISDSASPAKHRLAFGVGVYEPTLILAAAKVKKIDLRTLVEIRRRFLESYYKNKNNLIYPNILFEFQNAVAQAGQLDAYSHWVLMEGDPAAFLSWQAAHADKWKIFLKWLGQHPLKITRQHCFFRAQYDSVR